MNERTFAKSIQRMFQSMQTKLRCKNVESMQYDNN